MIKHLEEFGWPNVWLDTTKIYMLGRVNEAAHYNRDTKQDEPTYTLAVVVGGGSPQVFETKSRDATELERITRLHAFCVDQMQAREAAAAPTAGH